jgi:D-3-phosphoglycerate dehydrogenase|tara:strand:- start:3993 stop:4949 length:957 start_codon:yes stop_codon:yes gene_type:complete
VKKGATAMKKVLVTCPPMLGLFEEFVAPARELGLELVPAKTTQVLSEQELMELLPSYDGWIIGDDPATQQVFQAAKAGGLQAAVKWGVGVDNVDFTACHELGIPIDNTPQMFGGEVADMAIAYITGLARQTYRIDREIRQENSWPKPAGMSLAGKTIAIVGYGDIGYQTAKRLMGFDVNVIAYDPGVEGNKGLDYVTRKPWPNNLEQADMLVMTCSLNKHTQHMLNAETLAAMKAGSYVINVARGPLIDEQALIASLHSGHIQAAALDVFEVEPLPTNSPLREMPQCIFGSHNGSNTVEAVKRASHEALKKLARFLNE